MEAIYLKYPATYIRATHCLPDAFLHTRLCSTLQLNLHSSTPLPCIEIQYKYKVKPREITPEHTYMPGTIYINRNP